ncbi:MAG: hypothetical protein FJW56_05715 [Actinobacteria bacterium]|nr:hypothetical protein [Actinomycetota bacterium]
MKMKLRIFLLILLFASKSLISQPIPTEVKSTVAFIYLLNQKGEFEANGTGFFIGVRKTSTDSVYYVNFVTAKHVLKPDENNKEFYKTVFVRLNKIDGEAEYLRLDLYPDGKNKNVYTHTDSSVDIAVIPALPDQKIYDYKYMTDDFITTKDNFNELKIREGSNVFFTGMFVPFTGEHKNYPIVRFGKVALITEEKIMWDSIKTDLYLIESSSYGGNSGSPVFFYLGAEREAGSIYVGDPVLKLAGIMKGSFNDIKPIKAVDTKVIPVSISNMGISAVVPAYRLYEILYGVEMKQYRNRQ